MVFVMTKRRRRRENGTKGDDVIKEQRRVEGRSPKE